MKINICDVVMLSDEELYFVSGIGETSLLVVISTDKNFRTSSGSSEEKTVKISDVVQLYKRQPKDKS